ncbi:MAG: MmgE/PrpD family protein [Sphaerochaeta associata]|uniref:MmgE/PrpD family protein n=1 Tax=Sphaerochaeta associata TaxID=1129264 RepID=UPI002B1FE6F2|nr:MmgE/PrpD family protein [Sphaerochaeta associata]MEA5028679.1 MmgE/PrpD family protein [Sphaerochaeta associata]
MNRSLEFLNMIDGVWKAEIPEEVMARAKRSLLDYLAVTCAGAKFQKEKLEKYWEFAQPEEGKFRVIGTGKDLVLKEAVFLNGLNGHALDFDDGTNSGIIHLGSPIFSLLLPLAQRYGKTIDEVLKAAIVGYEASYTMAVSIQPGHKAMGYHATGTCGTLGATLVASYMLRFSPEERFQAFASACVAASGMLKVLDDGSELKPYNVAKTALLSLTALQLAKSGFKGHADPLGGRGFFRMMTGKEDIELKPVLLNGTYAIMKSYTKPYASCRYTHPAVEAAIHMREYVKPEDVEEIDIKTYDLAVSGHDHTDIPGSYSAKMSIPYATAAGLMFGKAGLQEFTEEMVVDKSILELTKKVKVEADEALSAVFPGIQAAIVTIRTKDGEYTERVDFPKGEPENPLTEDEFRTRYDGLMEYAGVPSTVSGELFDTVYRENAKAEELVRNI